MLEKPKKNILIEEVVLDFKTSIRLFIKREDNIHSEISGNKYWKLFFNVNNYLESNPKVPLLITFGGAYSNHIAAVSAFGSQNGISTLGIIRGEELVNKWKNNPTLTKAFNNGMKFDFVTRKAYQDKAYLTKLYKEKYPNALIIPEGGTNENAVEGIQYMLNKDTQGFNYLCSAVGTGGTLAGLSKFCEKNQKVIGFKAVADDSLDKLILDFSEKSNFELIDAYDGGYGKVTDENVDFINLFYQKYKIPLEPIYTGKMMRRIIDLIKANYFPENSTILAFHTGGLQGIGGVNSMLEKKNRNLIDINYKE